MNRTASGSLLKEGRLMAWLSRTDFILLLIAAYVAVITLVRLMKRRHDEVVADVQRQIDAHRRDKKRQANKTRDAA
jgi:cytidylate kinase